MQTNQLFTKQCVKDLQTLNVGQIRCNELLSLHTTWQIGGPAELLIIPESAEQVVKIVHFAHTRQIPLHIIGRGSNLLIADQGLKGIIVQLKDGLSTMHIQDDLISADAGVLISALAYQSADHQLSGLEFSEGIPGTVGGGLVMNAGAYGYQLASFMTAVTCCDLAGELLTIQKNAHDFAYRDSIFKNNPHLILLSAQFQLTPGDPAQIKARLQDYHAKRQAKQPLLQPSAGSVFKNPPGCSVAKLIESLGAKGWRSGDAEVSDQHSNFIVNLGHATCQDVLNLIYRIEQAVLVEYGIALEREIILLT